MAVPAGMALSGHRVLTVHNLKWRRKTCWFNPFEKKLFIYNLFMELLPLLFSREKNFFNGISSTPPEGKKRGKEKKSFLKEFVIIEQIIENSDLIVSALQTSFDIFSRLFFFFLLCWLGSSREKRNSVLVDSWVSVFQWTNLPCSETG